MAHVGALPALGLWRLCQQGLAPPLELCQLWASMSLSLREYAKRFNRSLRAIAAAADVDSGDIYAIADGRAGWTSDTAAKIKRATDGWVTPTDLLKVREAFQAQQAKASRRAQKKSALTEAVG